MSSARVPENRTVRVGLALFAAGLLFIAIDVVPFFFDDHNRPLWLNLACLLAPIGFAIAIGAALRAGRAEQRAALREVSRPS
jgi:peptidoglycan/LPS O-acetylase OafA/YrhL